MDTTQFPGARRRLAGLALAAALLGAAAAPAAAAVSTGSIYAGGLNTPGGSVWMGTHLGAPAPVNGLSRLAPAPATAKLPAGSMAPNAATCVLPGGGQPTFDPATNVVYVPDNSTQGTSVLRFKFNPTTETLRADGALGSSVIAAGTKPTGSVLDTDGSLYVSSGAAKAGKVIKITNPSGTQVDAAGTLLPTVASVIGTTSDGRGALGVTLANHSDGTPGRSLYLAEGSDITEIMDPATIKDPSTCSPVPCPLTKAQPTKMLTPTVINGKAVVWEGLDV